MIGGMERKSILLSLFMSLFLLCFSGLGRAQQTINGSIMHDGLQRDYILYIPASYSSDTPAPLLFNFHGYGSNAYEQMNYGDFRPIADTAGFLVVHPMGTEDYLGNTHWNVGWGGSSVDDVGFTAALIDSLEDSYHIDTDRIYSTGMSNGGFMSYMLACHLSDKFAAIASIAGSMNIGQTGSCSCQHPMPVMEIHGTADGTVPYDGTVVFMSIPDVLSYWVDFNNCDPSPSIDMMPDLDPNDGSTVTHYLYTYGVNGVEVEHYQVINGTHTWPGSNYDLGGTNYDIDASEKAWGFLSKYDIHGLIIPTAIEETSGAHLNVYPNPCTTKITITTNDDEDISYQIYSLLGTQLRAGRLTSRQQNIDLSDLAPNIYLLKILDQTFRILKVE
jgi:polyhydroxybutyrate depolymerase